MIPLLLVLTLDPETSALVRIASRLAVEEAVLAVLGLLVVLLSQARRRRLAAEAEASGTDDRPAQAEALASRPRRRARAPVPAPPLGVSGVR